jgi:predicted nucleotidyltransferase component of viral defense system
MIPNIFIEEWREIIKWRTLAQVEQDLIISRALTEIYNDAHISETLVFRGGTALNKLFLQPSARYSEDLDFVQKEAAPIGETIDAIRRVLEPWLGTPSWKITQRGAKLLYKYEAINNMAAKLKIEINTTEHFQVLPLKTEKFTINTKWFAGSADVITHEIDELMATKLRALYQRRKGRDLFDLWYVVTNELINVDRVIDIFSKYCEYNGIKISSEDFLKNLEQKKDNRDFKTDMDILLPSKLNWDFDDAYHFVTDRVIKKLP